MYLINKYVQYYDNRFIFYTVNIQSTVRYIGADITEERYSTYTLHIRSNVYFLIK